MTHTNDSRPQRDPGTGALTPAQERLWQDAADSLARVEEALAGRDLDAAERIVSGAADALRRAVGDVHPDYANALTVKSQVAFLRGDLRTAATLLRSALTILGLYLDDPEDAAIVRPLRAPVLSRLGAILALQGAFVASADCHREAIREAECAFGPDSPEVAGALEGLGVCLRFAGRYAEARATYERAAAMLRRAGQEPGANYHHNLAGLGCAEGDFVAAERHALDAIACRMKTQGNTADLGSDLCGLADALAGQGRNEEAERAYLDGMECFRRPGYRDHAEYAFALHNLADVRVALGRLGEAEATYLEAIERKLRLFGEVSHEVAASRNNLAALLLETGRASEARAQSSLAVAGVKQLGARHPIRIGCEALARSIAVHSH